MEVHLERFLGTGQSACVNQSLAANSLDIKTSNYQTKLLVLYLLITTPVSMDSDPVLQLLVRFGCILRNNTAFGRWTQIPGLQQLLQLQQVLRDLKLV